MDRWDETDYSKKNHALSCMTYHNHYIWIRQGMDITLYLKLQPPDLWNMYPLYCKQYPYDKKK